MKKNKLKFLSFILAHTIFISGCNIKNDNSSNIDEIILNQEETIINTIESTEPTETIIETTQFIEETTINETITEETIVEDENTEKIVTITEDAVIYSSDDIDSFHICNLKINERALKILSCNNNWTLVKYNNQIGYIQNDYLQITNTDIEKEYEYIKYNDIVLTTTELNFRTSPTTESEIIKTFKENTELEVIAKVDNGWLLVKHNGIIGYVNEDYTISLLEEIQKQYPNLNITELNIEKIVYSTGDDLNIRTGNSINNEIIDTLDKHESARVIGEYNGWYFVMTNEYKFGFISINYTKNMEGTFVVVDISKQRLYLYKNSELCYIAPVTTGKDSTPSDVGLFAIWYKGRFEEIAPGAPTNYWMPYNYNMEGLHDAENWRKEYGITEEEDANNCYKAKGSNGCINMKLIDAGLVYENVSIGTKVLVHK